MGRYRGLPELIDSPHDRIGVLVVNLGTPERPTYGPVRRYLGSSCATVGSSSCAPMPGGRFSMGRC
jgi:hypothetical protein